MGSLAVAIQEKEGRREKKKFLRRLFGLLNWTDVKILNREPKVLYLSFAL